MLSKFILFSISVIFFFNAYALNTSAEEKTCIDIGFKKKTEPFASCVLELIQRKENKSNTVPSSSNNPDDITCSNFGFKVGSNDFAQCKLQINNARQQAQIQQQQYEQQIRQYEEQKRQYEEQQALFIKEKKRQEALRGLDMSMGLMSGQYSWTDAGRVGMGLPPLPKPTPPQNQIFVMPNGRIVNCSTTGSITSCF